MPSNAPRPFDYTATDPYQQCVTYLSDFLPFDPNHVPAYPPGYVAAGVADVGTIPAIVTNCQKKFNYTPTQAWGSINVSVSEPGVTRSLMGVSNNPWYQAILS